MACSRSFVLALVAVVLWANGAFASPSDFVNGYNLCFPPLGATYMVSEWSSKLFSCSFAHIRDPPHTAPTPTLVCVVQHGNPLSHGQGFQHVRPCTDIKINQYYMCPFSLPCCLYLVDTVQLSFPLSTIIILFCLSPFQSSKAEVKASTGQVTVQLKKDDNVVTDYTAG